MRSITLQDLIFKSTLFEITKEFKGFKFKQNSRIEFTKTMKFLRTKYLQVHGLLQEKSNLML